MDGRVSAGRFLFAMWEGGGTAPPELAVASRLVGRGHEVSVLGDPSLADDVKSAGAQFSPWREAPHRATRTAESEIVRDWAALTPFGAFARARDRHAFKPARSVCAGGARSIRDAPGGCDRRRRAPLRRARRCGGDGGARRGALTDDVFSSGTSATAVGDRARARARTHSGAFVIARSAPRAMRSSGDHAFRI